MSIDILMAVYNGEKYLEKQLVSVFEQSFDDFRLLICDDCSTDRSKEIIEKFKAQYPEQITAFYNEKNIGAKENFFKLLSLSTAEYIMFCDQDDIWCKDKIKHTLECMKKNEHSKPTLVHTDLSVIDKNDKTVSDSMIRMQKIDPTKSEPNDLLVQNIATGCTMMINRSLADMIKKPSCPTLHDWWTAIVASLFGQIIFLPEATIKYRRHSSNIRGAKNMSSLGYIISRAADKKDASKMLKLGYMQSAELFSLYSDRLSPYLCEMLAAYGKCLELNKIKRIMTAKKYKIWKNGTVRKLGQLLFM